MPVDEVADVVAMRHSLVSTAGAMDVPFFMRRARVLRCASNGIRCGDLNDMLVHMTIVHVMKVTIVQIVDVVPVMYRRVTASWAVNMGMVGVLLAGACRHVCLLAHGGRIRSFIRK
ncbi:MAG: hypothetical protein AB7O43_18490 [Hyphomicrobiaceae bacterium]